MKKKRPAQKLSHADIIDLVRSGKYKVDFDEGIVCGSSGKPLSIKLGGRTGNYPRVRLFDGDKTREIAVSHVVWIAKTEVTIPNGFQIHHRDLDNTHNWWDNLFCLFHLDHQKLHYGSTLIDQPQTEETPF